jgi:hypothetical protein
MSLFYGIITVLILIIICVILHIRSDTQIYKLYNEHLLKYPVYNNSEAIYKQLALNAKETHPLKQIFGNQIYCICLASRQDRYDNICQQLEKIGLIASDITFYRPEKDPRGGIYGCHVSHRAINKLGFDSNSPFWLCLEDDLNITDQYEQVLENLRDFLPTNTWHIINMQNTGINRKKINDNFYYGYGYSTAAYIMNRSYFIDKGFHDGLLPDAYGYHIDLEWYINPKSPIYTPYVVYSEIPFISFTDLASDNNLPLVLTTLQSIFGNQNLYGAFKTIGGTFNSLSEYLARYIIIKTSNHL